MSDPHLEPIGTVEAALNVAMDLGLSGGEAENRRRRFGPNSLGPARRRSIGTLVVAQLRSVIVYLLAAAAALSLFLGDWVEGGAILTVLAINFVIGFATELRAVRSMEALRVLSMTRATVRRDGKPRDIPAEEIVPGDVVLLSSGDIVPADIRLGESVDLQCDESMLTGESLPVEKDVAVLHGSVPLAERRNMVFRGTAVTRGSGAGVAVATGMGTELGRIASLADTAEPEASPLEKRLDRLGGHLVWAMIGLTALIGASGVYAGHDPITMIKTAVALAVAAVPEGLPIVATVALARGMWRMARRNALIENLSAVETLGATTVILTDKTGTLTENRMTVARVWVSGKEIRLAHGVGNGLPAFTDAGKPLEPEDEDRLRTALRVAVLCNDARLSEQAGGARPAQGLGDPMEVALLAAGAAAGISQATLLGEMPNAGGQAFSTETRMMGTVHDTGTGYLVAVKGAPEAVIERSVRVLATGGTAALDDEGRAEWHRHSDAMTSEGLRVLALATKESDDPAEEPYGGLTLVGLVGLHDPPRPDIPGAIAACRAAGVRVVMVTGDHAGTARAIAAEIGLAPPDAVVIEADDLGTLDNISAEARERILRAPVFARVTPETKLDIVSLYQSAGEVVAMTGDGVNDAPALRKADIGVAMGLRGTAVAREAADIVLRDDAFTSIVAAMHQGRVIFGNIRKFVVYLLSCNISEIMVIGVATLSGMPLPLLPLQILYLNLVTDVFPAFALGVGEGDAGVMRRPPRSPKEPILGARRWLSVGLYGALISGATLGAFFVALATLGMGEDGALTVSFLTLALAQLWHVFNMRDPGSGLMRNDITGNTYLWAALALCVGLIVLPVYVEDISGILGLTPPDPAGWMLVGGASLVPLFIGQIFHACLGRRRPDVA